MKYIRLEPHEALATLIECYWMVENDDPSPVVQKIIPDGFTELIIHYGANYRTNITGEWQTQARTLLAGQISSYFYLENTGISGMVGIKFKPAALTALFGLQMSDYTNKIVDCTTVENPALLRLCKDILPSTYAHLLKEWLDNYFLEVTAKSNDLSAAATELIFAANGMLSVRELSDQLNISERHLERLFKKHIGLSPKYYSRIIRFNYIFELIQSKSITWSEVVYRSGYYDQSHFIRDFKAFTGEDPSAYYFEAENMANFFLKK